MQITFAVIGVAENIKYESLREKTLKTAYFLALQEPELRLYSMDNLNGVLPAARAAVFGTTRRYRALWRDRVFHFTAQAEIGFRLAFGESYENVLWRPSVRRQVSRSAHFAARLVHRWYLG